MKNILKNSKICVFCLLAFVIFIKCLFFHYSIFGYIAFRSIGNNSLEFFSFYFSKLWPALFIAGFIFVIKCNRWSIFVLLIIDVWLIANQIYYRANELFLDVSTITIATNMSGFWSSIIAYLNMSMLFYVLSTVVYIVFYYRYLSYGFDKRNYKAFVINMLLVIFFICFDFIWGYGKSEQKNSWKCNMFQGAMQLAKGEQASGTIMKVSWVENGTALHYIPASILYKFTSVFYRQSLSTIEFSDLEKQKLSIYVVEDSVKTSVEVKDNLILILFESFESWSIGIKDEIGQYITPNICDLLKKKHVLFVPKIRSQVRQGTSGDGQMIVNTGLLPLQNGAACMLYGENVYPNFAHFFNGCVINPSPRTWNQEVVSNSYGYKQTIVPDNGKVTFDDIVMNEMMWNQIGKCKKTQFCILGITTSTHSPFTHVDSKSLHLLEDMPNDLQNYLQSVHYADSCIGDFMRKIERDSLLENTTVVITGDHTIFKSALLRDFQPFAKKYNYPIPQEESYCPLIIISPNIQERIVVEDLCYQMDIYPTIMHCIGADNYYWKGFGVNLLDSIARNNRTITEEEAYQLSDKIIRSNYFSKIKDKE